MPDRLERALHALAEETRYPETPPLRVAVALEERAAARAPVPRVRLMPRRRLVVLVAVGLLLLLASVAVALRLGIGAISVRVRLSQGPAPTATATGARLGREVTLERAREEVGFRIRMPGALGPPDRVWVDRTWLGTRVAATWEAGPELPAIPDLSWGAVLMELRPRDPGARPPELAMKDLAPSNPIVETEVGGARALWITGSHTLTVRTGGPDLELRITGNVLIWQDGGVTMRLETALDLPDARRIAASTV